LGISAVGTIVTLSSICLAVDAPGMMLQAVEETWWGQALGLLAFVLIYTVVQLPFDLFGGYLLPRRYGRSHRPLASYMGGLARGVGIHTSVLFLCAVAIMTAGRYGGITSTVAAGLAMTLLLLLGRVSLAKLIGPLKLIPEEPTSSPSHDHLPIVMAHSPDEGFTGAVLGVFRPRAYLLPAKWRELLGPEGFEVAAHRRAFAVKTGSWWRGRAVALLFTLVGLTVSAWMVGPARLGTATGTVELSLWFSLWSFLGLLTLPTLSRRGVTEIDDRAQAEGLSPGEMRTTTRLLDELQDGEPIRPSLVEAIFHPIPSVQNRLDRSRAHGVIGFWDVARTSVYLSLAGMSLLSRAVHCNCGRPSLWVFLPTD
jgi:hypothetical protein